MTDAGIRDRAAARQRMVDTQLKSRDITDARVLDAMRDVPRHLFVPERSRPLAYEDYPLDIGFGQTISQPYVVAFMTQAMNLGNSDTVLEIGTGCGYQTAVLARLARHVYSMEIVEALAADARKTLNALAVGNVDVRTGNGYFGWPEHAPFDRVLVAAAPAAVPPALVEQLAIGGVMAIPVGPGGDAQTLRILRRTPAGLDTLSTLPVRFVPMTGKP